MLQDLPQRQPMVELNRRLREASIDGVPLQLGEREYHLLETIAAIARKRRAVEGPSIAELLTRFHVAKP